MAFAQELFTQQLDRAISARGISMRRAAAECGVHPAVFNRVKNGQAPDTKTLAAILDWLDVPADRFFSHDAPRSHRADFVVIGPDGSEMHVQLKTPRRPPTREVERLKRLASVAFEETVAGSPRGRGKP
jgi:transcriptional regulator with XRE-family HTH domain